MKFTEMGRPDGRTLLALHQPNTHLLERPCFTGVSL